MYENNGSRIGGVSVVPLCKVIAVVGYGSYVYGAKIIGCCAPRDASARNIGTGNNHIAQVAGEMGGETDIGKNREAVRIVGSVYSVSAPAQETIVAGRCRRNSCHTAIGVSSLSRYGAARGGMGCYRESVDGKVGNEAAVGCHSKSVWITGNPISVGHPVGEVISCGRCGGDGGRSVFKIGASSGDATLIVVVGRYGDLETVGRASMETYVGAVGPAIKCLTAEFSCCRVGIGVIVIAK